MSIWTAIIYGIAALWGVNSLLALMLDHRVRTLAKLQQKELDRRAAEEAEKMAQQAQLPGKKRKAA